MSFYAQDFIFADIPSEFFGLKLGEIDSSGVAVTLSSSDVELLTQKLYRRPVPLYYGAEQIPVLQFPLSMYSEDEIDAETYSQISAWLFGAQNYQVLRICQPDMQSTFFNAFLTLPQITRIGNIIKALSCTVVADAPWAWREPITETYNYSGYDVSETIEFFNQSANNFYTYPTSLIITANTAGGSVTITNTSDANRVFHLHLSANEVVTLNCDLQIISSSIGGTYPLVNLINKNWLRFIKGYNVLTVTGNVTSIVITYSPAVKIGG